MCGYFSICFIDYMFKDKSLTDYTNLFSPNNFKKNLIGEYFIAEIKERELMSKKLSKYISFFDYFDKSLIAFCLKCKKILRVLIQEFLQLVMVEQ